MGYARLEAEGLIVGTQEWQQKQKEKADERLLEILNSNITDSNITFTYTGRKTEELAEKADTMADTWTHTAKP